MSIREVVFIFICSFGFLEAKTLRNRPEDFLHIDTNQKSVFRSPDLNLRSIFDGDSKTFIERVYDKPHSDSHTEISQELEGYSQESTFESDIPFTDQSLESVYNLNNHKDFDQILRNNSPYEKFQKWKIANLSKPPKRSSEDFLSQDQVFVHPTGNVHKGETVLINHRSNSHKTEIPIEQSHSVEAEITSQESPEIKTSTNENVSVCNRCVDEHVESVDSGINKDSLAISHAVANPLTFLKNQTQFSSTSELNQSAGGEEMTLNTEINIFTSNTRSFVFNPTARPEEKFQECTTPNKESGNCRYLQHCLIPTIISSLNQFLHYVCIIESRFIGVCCPKFPVSTLIIKDNKNPPVPTNKEDLTDNLQCGIATNTRIVGGSTADPKAWPWMVALLSKSKKNFFCGGALISNQYVLTAAHCTFGIPNNEIIARLGEYDFKDNDQASHDDYPVVKIKRHGNYNRKTLRNDIALLKLEKPAVFSEFVTTICLPEPNNSYVEKTATLAGWGNLEGGGSSSSVLQEATFEVMGNKDCSMAHGVPIPSSLICTRVDSQDMGACNGDSGGPLMLLDDDNHWKAIGLVSWGRRGCNPKFPTVYTRVSHYLDWIKKHST